MFDSFVKVESRWHLDFRCRRLSTEAKWLYHCLWATAFNERSEDLPYWYSYTTALHDMTGIDDDKIGSCMEELERVGLVTLSTYSECPPMALECPTFNAKEKDGIFTLITVNGAHKAHSGTRKSTVATQVSRGDTREGKGGIIGGEEKSRAEQRREEQRTWQDYAFGKFWEAYPRHIAKAQARKCWNKQNIGEEILNQILKGIEYYKTIWKEEKFIPYPATFLNQERWRDCELEEVSSKEISDKMKRMGL